MKRLVHFYDTKYKKIIFIPIALFSISLIILLTQFATTGELFDRDVSLKGGVTITILSDAKLDPVEFQQQLIASSGTSDINVRVLRQAGVQRGLVIDAGIEDRDIIDDMVAQVQQLANVRKDNISIQVIGSTLAGDFLKQAIIAVGIAFVMMALVVLVYFRQIVPSLFVVSAAASDIITTLAVINMLDIKISAAGFAAFLMLIGYSVDTDILLTARMLKSKQDTLFTRIMSALKTGSTMTLTALGAILVALFFTQSDTIRQIMLVLAIGLTADLIYTWLFNALVLRWWLEKKGGML